MGLNLRNQGDRNAMTANEEKPMLVQASPICFATPFLSLPSRYGPMLMDGICDALFVASVKVRSDVDGWDAHVHINLKCGFD